MKSLKHSILIETLASLVNNIDIATDTDYKGNLPNGRGNTVTKITATKKLVLWHGGDLDARQDNVKPKKGRWEFGPGLYLTTHYDTAKKYAKGARKLYQVTIKEGNNLDDVDIDLVAVENFVNRYVTKSKREDLMDVYQNRAKDGKVSARVFLIRILNDEAVKPANADELRQFLVTNGVDYLIEDNLYGWGERAVVVYNMDIVDDYKRIPPKEDTMEDLPTEFS